MLSPESSAALLADRVIILTAGVAIAWMGYRLLATGLYERAVELKESSTGGGLLWKQWLPGTLFTLFAGVTLVVGLKLPVALTAETEPQSQSPDEPDEGAVEGDTSWPVLDETIGFLDRPEGGSVLIPTEG